MLQKLLKTRRLISEFVISLKYIKYIDVNLKKYM